MAHNLITNYGLDKHMDVLVRIVSPFAAQDRSADELTGRRNRIAVRRTK